MTAIGESELYPRGSEWRRWDLHVHTPDTALNDQFGDWHQYLQAIESQSDVVVLGVTDYLSIENYSKLRAYLNEGRISNILLLLPNIEFRLSPPTDRATAVNIHLLVDPSDPDHERQIRQALGRLNWEFKRQHYSCTPEQIAAFGRAYDPSVKDDAAALKLGTEQYKIDFAVFRDWYKQEHWLNSNSLVAVSGNADGLSGFRNDGAWAAHREEITRFSNIIFSGRPREREFWLGNGDTQAQRTLQKLGGPKPCVHGSDAHDIARLFKPDHDRYCWIKANPTFEGLKQIIFEPADRVFIGPTPPVAPDKAKVIDEVRLSGGAGWFDDVSIRLNAGLVSIIGEKGSGKSALAEVISYAAGSWPSDEQSSFIGRAGEHIGSLLVQLRWADGHVSEVRLGEGQPEGHGVRFLSQRFVERLCAEDRIGTELAKEIEAVVFSYLDPTETFTASDFAELRQLRTSGIQRERRQLREDLSRLIREERTLGDSIATLPQKRDRQLGLVADRDKLREQLPKASSEEEEVFQEKLNATREALAAAQRDVGQHKKEVQAISDIRTQIGSFERQIGRFREELDAVLHSAGIPEAEWPSFYPTFPKGYEPVLAARLAELESDVARKDGLGDPPPEGSIRALKEQLRLLTERETADKALQARTKTMQERISQLGTEVDRLQMEIEQISTVEVPRLASFKVARSQTYVEYFKTLARERDILTELYAPVSARLTGDDAAQQERKLEFSIRWEADIDRWLGRGSAFFDQRRTLPHGTMDQLGKAARRLLRPAWVSGDLKQIESAMAEFIRPFEDTEHPPEKYLRSGVTIVDVMEWIHEVDHIRLNYGLKYNGTPIEKLSPGTKGIVLLMLYLGMDVDDTRPLIVDQPDENLDNESIFNLLTVYFKGAKQRRQVVIITHNPNLVVNTDAEQVILASAERRENGLPYIRYRSGSLEDNLPANDCIRYHVCRVLEGGSDAFRKRERRYALEKD